MEKHFWVDGACSGNPGPGGFGVCNLDDGIFYSEYEENTTNNRQELKAILYVMNIAKDNPENIYIIHSDSAYAINSITSWMDNWAKNGWVRSKNQPIENLDLMKEIYYLKMVLFNIKLEKVKGHSGELGNEVADALASRNKQKYLNLIHKNNIVDF